MLTFLSKQAGFREKDITFIPCSGLTGTVFRLYVPLFFVRLYYRDSGPMLRLWLLVTKLFLFNRRKPVWCPKLRTVDELV